MQATSTQLYLSNTKIHLIYLNPISIIITIIIENVKGKVNATETELTFTKERNTFRDVIPVLQVTLIFQIIKK